MLFNSFPFLLVFLPLTLLIFFQIGRFHPQLAAGWLAAASLFFYGWWNPAYVGLLLGSIAFNFSMGYWIAKARQGRLDRLRRHLLFTAVVTNLLLLGYYKYANFFVSNIDSAFDAGISLGPIILPLGISFFTFTQIAFLVDAYRGEVKEYNFIHYGLFVTYFPHLIAGPVLHHKEMMPQFSHRATYRPSYRNFAVGLTLFSIGLFKKTVLADGVAPFTATAFGSASALTPLAAWGGALAYTLQLYFDFSGYSDMAIGLSRLFGVRLPLNFNSPYKATSIIDFWRRWHMTLSRFLRDYLYIPLGGGHCGKARRYLNLMATMLLGGLWHGAGWTFVIWGGLHGLYLVANHGWRTLNERLGNHPYSGGRLVKLASGLLTFIAVVIAWVFFRATDMNQALHILSAMFGFSGGIEGHGWRDGVQEMKKSGQLAWISALLAIAWLAPNTQEIMARAKPTLEIIDTTHLRPWLLWRPNLAWLIFAALLLAFSLFFLPQGEKVSEFLYFQF